MPADDFDKTDDFDKLERPDRREQLLSWLTPGRKATIVGGLTLIPALGIGLVLNGLFSQTTARSNPEPPKSAPELLPVAKVEPAQSRELDRLKAEVALSDQRRMIDTLEKPKPKVLKPQLPPAMPVIARLAPPPMPPAPVSYTPARPDLQNLAYLGSSQEGEGRNRAPLATLPPPRPMTELSAPVRSQATSLDPSLERPGVQSVAAVERPGVQSVQAAVPTVNLSTSQTESAAVPATTLAAAVLERPVLWEQDDRQTNPGAERYLAVLTEPVSGATGNELLPAGTRVVVKIERISANGLVAMQAVALRVSGREVPLQAVSVRAAGGLPLQASRNDKGGEISGLDAGQAIIKGAEDGLGIINRPSSTNQSSGIGGSSYAVNYDRPNPIAAMGSGIFSELGRVIRQRNQQAVKQIENRPNLWWLPAGTAVELLFAREVRL